MQKRLRNKRGGQLTVSGLSHLLRNPFYMGYLRFDGTVLQRIPEDAFVFGRGLPEVYLLA
jgi:hypothetical protein